MDNTLESIEQPINAPPLKQQTALAKLVHEKLSAAGLRQSEFCRAYNFDQGLLSKVMNSVITNLSLETVLRLAVGLNEPPERILKLINRDDLDLLVTQAYSKRFTVIAEGASTNGQL